MDGDFGRALFPHHPNWEVRQVSTDAESVTAEIAITTPTVDCPVCGQPATRRHSRYVRRLTDLPWCGRRLTLVIAVRRFFCDNPACNRKVFCERLPALATAHGRTTAPLTAAHRAIGFAVGGEAGARLATHLAMPTSADTVLRRVKSAPAEELTVPRVVGVDDWAWKKGIDYGTIIIDLEHGRVLDILPGRDGEALRAWLQAHPQVEVMTRDRSVAFAQAADAGVPHATQVADRWHLLKNLREVIERLLERSAGLIKDRLARPVAAAPAVAESSAARGPEPAPVPDSPRRAVRQVKRQRRVERFGQVQRLHHQGASVCAIAAALKLSRGTVMRYIRAGQCPDWKPTRPRRTTPVHPLREEIDRRILAGCTNAAKIHRGLTAAGHALPYKAVQRFVRRRLAALGQPRVRAGRGPPVRPPSARRLSFEVVRRPENRTADEQAHVATLHAIPEVADGLILAEEFLAMARRQSNQPLAAWLTRAEQSTSADFRRLARGIRADEPAVPAALTETWSNGPVEGHVNRLKLLKRSMYGRAGFPLLRARVRHAA